MSKEVDLREAWQLLMGAQSLVLVRTGIPWGLPWAWPVP